MSRIALGETIVASSGPPVSPVAVTWTGTLTNLPVLPPLVLDGPPPSAQVDGVVYSCGGPSIVGMRRFNAGDSTAGVLTISGVRGITADDFFGMEYNDNDVLAGLILPDVEIITVRQDRVRTSDAGFMGYYATWSAMTALSLPKLRFLSSIADVRFPAVTAFSLPLLEVVQGALWFKVATATSVSLPQLRLVGGELNIEASAIGSLSLPSLERCQSVTLSLNAATSVSLPALQRIGTTSMVAITAPSMTSLTINTQATSLGNNFSVSSSSLNQASVDSLLSFLNTFTSANGKAVLSTVTVGGAAPSNGGSASVAGTAFVRTGGSLVTVTLASHGYATGDVLRISGLTGSSGTSMNRYAVITVTGSGTFTYTASGTNGTATGTATVIKANATVKDMVTRGVTLTTN